jgi:hypothetical protein
MSDYIGQGWNEPYRSPEYLAALRNQARRIQQLMAEYGVRRQVEAIKVKKSGIWEKMKSIFRF